eukprot:Gb_01472 [translate_table: standard]
MELEVLPDGKVAAEIRMPCQLVEEKSMRCKDLHAIAMGLNLHDFWPVDPVLSDFIIWMLKETIAAVMEDLKQKPSSFMVVDQLAVYSQQARGPFLLGIREGHGKDKEDCTVSSSSAGVDSILD